MIQGSATFPGVLANRHALVVEDDKDALDLLATILKIAGANVAAADSFDSALEALKRFTPDVLVLDIGMPKYNGYALIAKIRSQALTQHIPAVAVTGFATPTDRDTALSAGFQAYISKPFEPENLLRVITQLLLKHHKTA
ncbi:MAG TPA: response regulator [Xanthobacteraceae bacterium]|nr:response regulator [Xanthobacteraceae bacterium]